MFENLLSQPAGEQLREDLSNNVLPPAILFAGPVASGKGTAALELARVLSCEDILQEPTAPGHETRRLGRASWQCQCPACTQHRLLEHPDLLMMGRRDFASELRASADAWHRDGSPATRFLFKRAIGKLLARFSPTLWEGEEQKLGKAATLVGDIRELTEEIELFGEERGEKIDKILDKLLQAALSLESGFLPASVPISWVRNAAWWARSTPFGRHKTIFIEEVDRLQEGARNALLKLLEEPPETCTLILSTTRRHAVMETILSRLRTYRFMPRSLSQEAEVVSRVFKAPDAASEPDFPGLSSWLEGFMPVSPDLLRSLAAIFILAIFDELALAAPGRHRSAAPLIDSLSPSLERAVALSRLSLPSNPHAAVALVLENSGKFEPRSLYARFLAAVLDTLSPALRSPATGPLAPRLADSWKAIARQSESAVLTYNQSPPQALDALFFDLYSALSRALVIPSIPPEPSACVPS